MGAIRKFVLSLLLAATLAHGQLSIDLNNLNGGDITAPLQHQGKIEQQYYPGNIERTYGDAPGQHLAPSDENIETIYVNPEGRSPHLLYRQNNKQTNMRRSTQIRRSDSREKGLISGFFNGIADTIGTIIGVFFVLVVINTMANYYITKTDQIEKGRMFKEIEDSAVANFMTSIDEFKTKYLN